MGYRNYIASIPRAEYNKIKNFTKEELFKYKNKPIDKTGYVEQVKININYDKKI